MYPGYVGASERCQYIRGPDSRVSLDSSHRSRFRRSLPMTTASCRELGKVSGGTSGRARMVAWPHGRPEAHGYRSKVGAANEAGSSQVQRGVDRDVAMGRVGPAGSVTDGINFSARSTDGWRRCDERSVDSIKCGWKRRRRGPCAAGTLLSVPPMRLA